MPISAADLEEFVSRLEREVESYLKSNLRQRFSIGHPGDFIMPVIKYCLHAVKETLSGDASIDPKSFSAYVRLCIADIIRVLARTAEILDRDIIPRVARDIEEMRAAKVQV
jgi:hypothetical protein